MVQGCHDENVIHIGNQRLDLHGFGEAVRVSSAVRAEERRPARTDGLNQAVAVRIHRNLHIVADDGIFVPVAQAACQDTVILFCSVPDKIAVPVNQDNAIQFIQFSGSLLLSAPACDSGMSFFRMCRYRPVLPSRPPGAARWARSPCAGLRERPAAIRRAW